MGATKTPNFMPGSFTRPRRCFRGNGQPTAPGVVQGERRRKRLNTPARAMADCIAAAMIYLLGFELKFAGNCSRRANSEIAPLLG